MTLKELYLQIDASFDQATSVLRAEKLIDKHIRKFPHNGVVDAVIAAGGTMDPTQLFESAHAMKGVCSNLGLVKLAAAASRICEEFRPGNLRTMSDDDVRALIAEIEAQNKKTVEAIGLYEASAV